MQVRLGGGRARPHVTADTTHLLLLVPEGAAAPEPLDVAEAVLLAGGQAAVQALYDGLAQGTLSLVTDR